MCSESTARQSLRLPVRRARALGRAALVGAEIGEDMGFGPAYYPACPSINGFAHPDRRSRQAVASSSRQAG